MYLVTGDLEMSRILLLRTALSIMAMLLGLFPMSSAFGNQAPVALDDRVKVRGLDFVLIDVLANDSDADGDPLVATATGGVPVTNLGDGLFKFQPTACLWAPVSFTYQIEDAGEASATATVHLVPGGCGDNLNVLAVPDVTDTSPEEPVVVAVLDNDSDADGDPLCVDRVVEEFHGTTTITADCLYVWFTPDPGYEGPDAGFRYFASDGEGGEDDALVSINVTNSPPSDDYGEDSAVTERDKRLLLSSAFLLGNDATGATFVDAYSLIGDRVDVIWPPGGIAHVLYQPPAGYEGSRVFKYQAKSASGETFEVDVTITVLPPVGTMRAMDDDLRTVRDGCLVVDLDELLENDEASGDGVSGTGIFLQPLVGSLTEIPGSGGRKFTYQAAPGYQGKDAFTYTASDSTPDGGGSTDVATAVIDLYDPNDAGAGVPVAQGDSAEMSSVTTGHIFLSPLENDYDPDCGPLDLISVSASSFNASITTYADGSLRYDPVFGTFGTERLTYSIRDSQGYSAQSTLTIDLVGELEPPWPRITYRDCADLETCVADGGDSRRGNSTHYGWGNCTSYWHFEGSNAPAPPGALPCHPAYHRQSVQDVASFYSAPGLFRAELTLTDSAAGVPTVRATSDRRIPFGATTTEWTVGHSCVQGSCTFWPVGTWMEGVAGGVQWFFDGYRYSGGELDPDVEMLGPDAVPHTYSGALAGDTFHVIMVVDVFDQPNGVEKSLWITIPPPPPAAPSGLATDNTICTASGPRLSWVDGSSNEDGFTVYRSVNGGPMLEVGSVEANETELQDFYDGPRDDLLTYQVASFNEGGEGMSEAVSGRPTPADCGSGQQVPQAPSLLAAFAPSNGIRLTWRDNSALEAGHRLYRSEAGGPFLLQATLPSNQETAFDQPVAPGATYAYRVTAFNSIGESAPTSDVTVVVPPFLFADSFESGDLSAWTFSQGLASPPPSALAKGSTAALAAPQNEHLLRPSQVHGQGFRRGGVELAWRDNSSNEDGFRLLRKKRGGSYQEVASLAPNTTTYFDHPLDPGTAYRYRVVAFTNSGKQKTLRSSPYQGAQAGSRGFLRKTASRSDVAGARSGRPTRSLLRRCPLRQSRCCGRPGRGSRLPGDYAAGTRAALAQPIPPRSTASRPRRKSPGRGRHHHPLRGKNRSRG